MKKKINIAALALIMVASASAQTIYDGAKFTQKDLNGTARFVGMGGAMGALGGDISTMGTNPAGIGIYRSNDIMGTFGFSSFGSESKYEGSKFNVDKTRGSFDNIGFVFSSKIGNQTALRYVNFGFSYTRSKSFDKYMTMEGLINLGPGGTILSQTNQMTNQANTMIKANGDFISKLADDKINLFTDSQTGWLAAIGWNGYLYNENEDKNGYIGYLPQPYSWYDGHEKGGINQYDFNVAFNISDRVYLGLTIGAYDVNYSKISTYGEEYGEYIVENVNYGTPSYEMTTENKIDGSGVDFKFGAIVRPFEDSPFRIGAYDVNYSKISTYGEEYGEYIVENVNYGTPSYEMTTENKIDGSGVDFKFGAIVRPFEDSPFRIGVSVHTPTFYNLKIKTNVRAVTYTPDFDSKKLSEAVVDSYDFTNGVDYGYDFRFRTPWKYNLSLGYTYGSSFAIGAEYEYQDYSAMHFSYSDGEAMGWQNPTAKEMLKGVNTFRIGAEWKVIPQFAFRLGYNYMSAAFKKTAFKDLSYNSINTDTDFANAKANNNYTLGIGYRGSTFYADLAYMYSTYKEDFYPFDDGALKKTDVTNSRSKVMMTLGLRF